MIKASSILIDVIMSNPVTYGMLNRFLDSIQGVNPYYMSYDIEYICALVAKSEEELSNFANRHKGNSRYMQFFEIAMNIRCELKEMLNLKDCMNRYETL